MIEGLFRRVRGRPAPSGVGALDEAARSPQNAAHLDTPSGRQLAEVIAEKVLHGWLQNRHQTQMPLSVNFGRFTPDERVRFARFAALAVSAGTDPGAGHRVSAFLTGAGADPTTLAAYEDGLSSPPPLSVVLDGVAASEHAGMAYVLALVAGRNGVGGDAGRAFADYVAKRLAVSSAAQRSAQRRYGN